MPAIGVVLVACVLLARTTLALEFEHAFQNGPVCWHYVNSEGEEFLLKLRTLSLGRTSFLVSGVLAGTAEGSIRFLGMRNCSRARVKSSLVLNDASPTIATSTFLSGVLFIVDLDPETLHGVFEWIPPTLSGPDPNGPRAFQAFSLRGTLTFLSHRRSMRAALAIAGGACAMTTDTPGHSSGGKEGLMQGRALTPKRAEVPSTGARLPEDVQDDPVARQFLQEVHARMYKWPAAFAGYRAVLTVQEEERLWHGEATVQPQQAVDVQLDSDESVRAWVHESLSTQAMHLADIPFAQGDGRYVLTFDPQETGTGRHPRGVRVLLHGGRLASWYRIQEQRYSQIGRTAPDGTRRINTIERYEAAADGRLYATHYILAHFPAHGASLVGLASYVNEFVEHQPGLLLPSRRTIWQVEGGRTRARVIALSTHRVLG